MIGTTGSARPPIVNVRATLRDARSPCSTSVLGGGVVGVGLWLGSGVESGLLVGLAVGDGLGDGADVALAVGDGPRLGVARGPPMQLATRDETTASTRKVRRITAPCTTNRYAGPRCANRPEPPELRRRIGLDRALAGALPRRRSGTRVSALVALPVEGGRGCPDRSCRRATSGCSRRTSSRSRSRATASLRCCSRRRRAAVRRVRRPSSDRRSSSCHCSWPSRSRRSGAFGIRKASVGGQSRSVRCGVASRTG